MIKQGDCRELMRELSDNSVDAVVTDPPYELGFMGKSWDSTGIAYDVAMWLEVLRVLKPGAHLLSFGGTRTYHRMACAIEDAGFQIRDQLQWIYGSGFPKSLDISKAIDKEAGLADQREVIGYNRQGTRSMFDGGKPRPASLPASLWQGWGTALKPANEPICLARKPLSEKTVAQNVLTHGTGGINIDGCRIETNGETPQGSGNPSRNATREAIRPGRSGGNGGNITSSGRFPSNVIFGCACEVEHEAGCAVKILDEQSGELTPSFGKSYSGERPVGVAMGKVPGDRFGERHQDFGTASRFFYIAKASPAERDEYMHRAPRPCAAMEGNLDGSLAKTVPQRRNTHPTVKPISLMRYLCRLVTPPGGLVLDPFAGSGTTLIAARLEGFQWLGFELDPEHVQIAEQRMSQSRLEL